MGRTIQTSSARSRKQNRDAIRQRNIEAFKNRGKQPPKVVLKPNTKDKCNAERSLLSQKNRKLPVFLRWTETSEMQMQQRQYMWPMAPFVALCREIVNDKKWGKDFRCTKKMFQALHEVAHGYIYELMKRATCLCWFRERTTMLPKDIKMAVAQSTPELWTGAWSLGRQDRMCDILSTKIKLKLKLDYTPIVKDSLAKARKKLKEDAEARKTATVAYIAERERKKNGLPKTKEIKEKEEKTIGKLREKDRMENMAKNSKVKVRKPQPFLEKEKDKKVVATSGKRVYNAPQKRKRVTFETDRDEEEEEPQPSCSKDANENRSDLKEYTIPKISQAKRRRKKKRREVEQEEVVRDEIDAGKTAEISAIDSDQEEVEETVKKVRTAQLSQLSKGVLADMVKTNPFYSSLKTNIPDINEVKKNIPGDRPVIFNENNEMEILPFDPDDENEEEEENQERDETEAREDDDIEVVQGSDNENEASSEEDECDDKHTSAKNGEENATVTSTTQDTSILSPTLSEPLPSPVISNYGGDSPGATPTQDENPEFFEAEEEGEPVEVGDTVTEKQKQKAQKQLALMFAAKGTPKETVESSHSNPPILVPEQEMPQLQPTSQDQDVTVTTSEDDNITEINKLFNEIASYSLLNEQQGNQFVSLHLCSPEEILNTASSINAGFSNCGYDSRILPYLGQTTFSNPSKENETAVTALIGSQNIESSPQNIHGQLQQHQYPQQQQEEQPTFYSMPIINPVPISIVETTISSTDVQPIETTSIDLETLRDITNPSVDPSIPVPPPAQLKPKSRGRGRPPKNPNGKRNIKSLATQNPSEKDLHKLKNY